MKKSATPLLPKLFLVSVASATLAVGASTAASATTGTTEPADDMTAHTEAEHTMDTTAGSLAVDGSAEASSPEAEAFCTAEIAAEAAFNSEDQAAIGPAVEDLTAATPTELTETVEALLANAESGPGDPAFDEPYGAVLDYMRANCGFAELGVVASEYAFGGVPAELPAGPAIVTLENIGQEIHVFDVARINDDVELTTEELLALPEEEVFTMITRVGGAFANPGSKGYGVLDLTPGHYIAVCPIPQGLTPEVEAQFEEAEGSVPEGSAPAGTELGATESAATESAATEPAGTQPAGSGPAGSAPGGPELGPPHFTLGMVHEFTVV